MQTTLKKTIIGAVSTFLLVGVMVSVGSSEPSAYVGKAADSTTSFTLPTAGSDSATAFTTTTIFSGTGGLDAISPSQTIISSANTTSNIYLGVNGYLIGALSTSTNGGQFRFKTSNNITAITATFTKYSTELATVYIRSGWVSGTGDIQESYTLQSGDNTKEITYSPIRSYYFEIGTSNGTSSTNQAYLTSISFTYNDSINPLSLKNSFNFIDGGSSSTSSYTATDSSTSVSYESDNPGGAGTTAWIADWANLSLSTGTRIGTGGTANKSTVQTDDTTAWANLRTNFTFSYVIHAVKILNSVVNTGSATFENLYLQYSADGASWVTTSIKTVSDINNGVLFFADISIPSSSYLRFGISTTSSASNTQFNFTGLQTFSYSNC